MFCRKKIKKLQELYDSLNRDYFKLRKDYWDLVKELDDIQNQDKDLKIFDCELTIKKLSKELIDCKKLLNEYHLYFGDECFEILKRKSSKINKRMSTDIDDNEGVEL